MRLSCEGDNSGEVDLHKMYNEMFRYQVKSSSGKFPLILITLENEIEL